MENLCERCNQPENNYDVAAINRKLKKIAKGRAGWLVNSFLCSQCVQMLVDEVKEEKEDVPEANEAGRNLVRKGFVRSAQPSNLKNR